MGKGGSQVTLKVGDYIFNGWDEIKIRKSMNEMACSFALVTDDFSYGDFSKWKMKLGDIARVYIHNKLVCTGYLDKIPIYYGNDDHYIQFVGRGKTSDLIDCTYEGTYNEWKNYPCLRIIKDLCSPFNIDVAVQSGLEDIVNQEIANFKANEGEFVYSLINDLCIDLGILPLDMGDGKLTLAQTSNEKLTDPIQRNVNVSSGLLVQDNTDRYSSYTCKGYGNGTDQKSLADFIHPSGNVVDEAITRTRPFTIFADRPTDKGKCKNRAIYEARIRAGASRALLYEVMEFVQMNKEPWNINRLVNVRDGAFDISDTMLVSEVEWVMSPDIGQVTYMIVVDKDTYSGSTADIDIKTGFDS